MSLQINNGTYPLSDESAYSGDYATLAGYNSGPTAFIAGPPVPSQSAVQPVVIVPSYGGVGYSILQNNLPFNQLTNSGYFTVNNAYPSYGNNCQAYITACANSTA